MLFISRQTISASLVICFSIVGIGLLQFPRLQKIIHNKSTSTKEVIEKDVQAEKLRLSLYKRLPTFGYDNLMANWVYLSFLQYFGDDEARSKTGYSLSPEYFEVILTRDPKFIMGYLAMSTSTSMYAAMPERSVALAEKGLKSLSPWVPSRSYYAWRYKAVDELLFLGNSQAARKSFENAANWASKHSDAESKQSNTISRGTANFLSRNPNSKYAQISAWGMILSNGVDKTAKKRAIKAIQDLGGEVISTPQGDKIRFPQKD
jgi:hypothetical protein